ncbi:MAG: hypothetical protein ACO1RT_15040 [Planctomycetaceae bacterium]
MFIQLTGHRMGRIGSFFSGMVAGMVLFFVLNHYHLVRSDDGLFVVPKLSQNLQDSYVDIRNFGLRDWQEHRLLAASILRSGRHELLEDSSLTGFRKTVVTLMDGLLAP